MIPATTLPRHQLLPLQRQRMSLTVGRPGAMLTNNSEKFESKYTESDIDSKNIWTYLNLETYMKLLNEVYDALR